MTNLNNPYTDFVKSLTDEQLDTLWASMQDVEQGDGELWQAAANEWESRERSTKLTFYTPHVDEFKRLLAEEQRDSVVFAQTVIANLSNVRLAPGWSPELEAAFKILIIELVEQIT